MSSYPTMCPCQRMVVVEHQTVTSPMCQWPLTTCNERRTTTYGTSNAMLPENQQPFIITVAPLGHGALRD